MSDWPVLTTLILVPLIAAALVAVSGSGERGNRNARQVALWGTVAEFLISLVVWFNFDRSEAGFQFVEQTAWFAEGISYHLGIDGISMLFILLSTALMPICILASFESVQKRVKEYMIAFLVMESILIGVFSALDFTLFYFFFEAGLIPMFLIIGIWGGARRIYASFKFFLYTMLGSVLLLLALIYMYITTGTTDIPTLIDYGFSRDVQIWIFLAFFASFAVKTPMWPVHTWLPDAHVEAPTAGSVLLAGVLLKMGTYGFVRFSLAMLPEASEFFAPMIWGLSIVAIIYTSLIALMQEDMKKLIAYSSVAHMGFVTIGVFSFNAEGLEGALLQMVSHGIVSGALFLCVGVVYDRMHTREIAAYGGLVRNMPVYAVIFLLFTMATIGLPGTSGFVGEFLILLGAFKASTWVAFLASFGIILGAAYSLWLYRRVVYGELVKEELKGLKDLSSRELLLFAPLVVLTLWMGIYPEPFLNVLHASVDNLLANHHAAIEAAQSAVEAASQ